MAEFPYLPIWTDAYLADTTHLHTEEHGAYLLLLFSAWRTPDCSLPDDDAILARVAGLSPSRWKAMKPTVMAFWKIDKRRKRWVQKRLQIERGKATAKRGKAKDSAASRWKQTKTDHANAMRTQCYPEPEPYPQEKDKSFSPRERAKKSKGWVDPKTPLDAANNIIQRIRDNEQQGIGSGDETACGHVLQLSALGRR